MKSTRSTFLRSAGATGGEEDMMKRPEGKKSEWKGKRVVGEGSTKAMSNTWPHAVRINVICNPLLLVSARPTWRLVSYSTRRNAKRPRAIRNNTVPCTAVRLDAAGTNVAHMALRARDKCDVHDDYTAWALEQNTALLVTRHTTTRTAGPSAAAGALLDHRETLSWDLLERLPTRGQCLSLVSKQVPARRTVPVHGPRSANTPLVPSAVRIPNLDLDLVLVFLPLHASPGHPASCDTDTEDWGSVRSA